MELFSFFSFFTNTMFSNDCFCCLYHQNISTNNLYIYYELSHVDTLFFFVFFFFFPLIFTNTMFSNDPPEFFSNVVGFVPQEDVMHDDFSIEENLQFSAEWRLDQEIFSLETRRGIVNDVLSRLGISQWRHDRVGRGSDTDKSHVSGGQKKRVNIGIELVADPGILFLDEPTSGLDSVSFWFLLFFFFSF